MVRRTTSEKHSWNLLMRPSAGFFAFGLRGSNQNQLNGAESSELKRTTYLLSNICFRQKQLVGMGGKTMRQGQITPEHRERGMYTSDLRGKPGGSPKTSLLFWRWSLTKRTPFDRHRKPPASRIRTTHHSAPVTYMKVESKKPVARTLV